MTRLRPTRLWLLLGCASTAAACAGSTPPPADATTRSAGPTAAVLHARWVTSAPDPAPDAAGAMSAGLTASRGLRVHDHGAAFAAMGAAPDGCDEDLTCVRRVAGGLGVDKAVLIRLAQLGSTVVVQARMVDVRGGSGEQSLQQVVRGADSRGITAALRRMGEELGRPYAPAPEPETRWYERWWVWTAAAVVVAGATTAVVLTTTGGDGQAEPDFTVTPPRPR